VSERDAARDLVVQPLRVFLRAAEGRVGGVNADAVAGATAAGARNEIRLAEDHARVVARVSVSNVLIRVAGRLEPQIRSGGRIV
jgi:hypothetical protein